MFFKFWKTILNIVLVDLMIWGFFYYYQYVEPHCVRDIFIRLFIRQLSQHYEEQKLCDERKHSAPQNLNSFLKIHEIAKLILKYCFFLACLNYVNFLSFQSVDFKCFFIFNIVFFKQLKSTYLQQRKKISYWEFFYSNIKWNVNIECQWIKNCA